MRRTIAGVAVVSLSAALACTAEGPTRPGIIPDGSTPPGFTHVTPILLPDNPRCEDVIPGSTGFRIDPPTPGTYAFADGKGSFTFTSSDGIYFDWTSNKPILGVIAKGGNAANLYLYPAPGETADTDLRSPDNASGGPAAISHIDVCYDLDTIILFGLSVSKTADTRFDRTWTWDIEKTGDVTDLKLALGQTYPVNYTVTPSATSADDNWEVFGSITITNTNTLATEDITIDSEPTDNVPPAAAVDCGTATFPYVLQENTSLVCTYSAAMPGPGSDVNTASVEASYNARKNTFIAQDPWDFATATVNQVDDCVDVSDDKYGALGTICYGALPTTFTYTINVGGYDTCGDYTYVNTASFATNDRGVTGSDDHTVAINVPCSGGCTLTPGYWKTHSSRGPAPYDDAWLAIGALGADQPFFLSGQTYYQVLWTAPLGNAYYILAHAYIAAKLNILNGASSTPAVDAAITAAEGYFTTKTPSSTLTRAQRNALIAYAVTLDGYNNGLVGPGHCSERTT